jgi:tetratricopeptide (TPR) repeat protein
LRTRFEQRGIQGDIDEAIELYEEVVALRPSPNPARSSSLNNLAGALRASFEKQGTAVELDHIVELYRQAATYQSSPLSSRFLASTEWAQCATKHNHNTILAAYQQAINLLPELAALDLDITSRQQRLTGRQVTALAADSATAAIAQDRAALAVEFLEASRSIFWSQALQLRTPLDKLLVRDWELGDKLRNISRQLDQSAFRDSTRAFDTSSQGQQRQMSTEDEGTRLHELDEDRRVTLAEIRKISGFEDFLLPKKLDALRQAAGSGPVVVLLAQKSGSSALILEPSGGVQHVEFPTWTPQKFELCADLPRILSDDNHEDVSGGMEARDFPSEVVDLGARLFGGRERVVKVNPDERLRRYLAELWTSIVKPVVVALGLKVSPHIVVQARLSPDT